MTGAEFKERRKALGRSIGQMAEVLDVRADTVRKWESGKGLGPHPTACVVLGWMEAGFEPSDFESDDRVSSATSILPGNSRCMDCRCDGSSGCPGQTPEQVEAWRASMGEAR